jgi:hypothetical protein
VVMEVNRLIIAACYELNFVILPGCVETSRIRFVKMYCEQKKRFFVLPLHTKYLC